MEAITNAQDDFLIDSLSFKLGNGASYVQERKSSTFWATGSNIYKAESGVKVIRFQLNGDDGNWLDPSSVIVQFELKNESTDTDKNFDLLVAHIFGLKDLGFWLVHKLWKILVSIEELLNYSNHYKMKMKEITMTSRVLGIVGIVLQL